MLRIIVGQDPYPDIAKRLIVPGYPFSPVAFWQKVVPVNDTTFDRFLKLVNASNAALPTPEKEMIKLVDDLKVEGYYFFNVYEKLKTDAGYVKSKNLINKEIMKIIKTELASGTVKEDVHVCLVGAKARDRMAWLLKKESIKPLILEHPSPANRHYSGEWENIPTSVSKIFQI